MAETSKEVMIKILDQFSDPCNEGKSVLDLCAEHRGRNVISRLDEEREEEVE